MKMYAPIIVTALMTFTALSFAAQPTCPVTCQDAIAAAVNEAVVGTDSCNVDHQPTTVTTIGVGSPTAASILTIKYGKPGFVVPICASNVQNFDAPKDLADGSACMTYLLGLCREKGLDININ